MCIKICASNRVFPHDRVSGLSGDRAWNGSTAARQRRPSRALLGTLCAGLVCALAIASSPAAATAKSEIKAGVRHKKKTHVSKEPFGNIPKGPLQIIISINQQKLHLYSDGAHVADAPVATGVPDHPTPLGVFNVIGKERHHRSNIYSRAPMPYMQRITWSGIAIHEGVGVGHPASHGCIRIPHDFAVRLWALTRLGAGVIIARPELRPQEFSNPHLFVHKEQPPAPIPTAALAAVEPTKTAQTTDDSKTTDAATPAIAPVPIGDVRSVISPLDSTKPAAAAEDATGAKNPEPAVKPVDTAETDQREAAGKSADRNPVDPQAPTTTDVNTPAAAADRNPAPAPSSAPPAPEDGASAALGTAGTLRPAIDAALETVPMPFPKPAELAKARKRAPIAIFVSRKTAKIYVRQDFAPLFDAPISIEHPGRPLGTHVFTAMQFMADGATLRWTVVSLPGVQPPRAAQKAQSRPERDGKRKRRGEPVAESAPDPPPETPHEALARIQIPQDAINRISALIVPGSSLIVSDQGLGEETGEGTDFIVVTREEARSGRRADNSAGLNKSRHRSRHPILPAEER